MESAVLHTHFYFVEKDESFYFMEDIGGITILLPSPDICSANGQIV